MGDFVSLPFAEKISEPVAITTTPRDTKRALLEKSRYYKFEEEAHVHGIMDGEAVEMEDLKKRGVDCHKG